MISYAFTIELCKLLGDFILHAREQKLSYM
jgi:hypothetical protein